MICIKGKIEMEFVSEEELEVLSKNSRVEILDAIKGIPFKEKSWIPDDCGVYILTRTDKEQYIGSSHDIIKRTKNHHIEDIDTIDVYLTCDYKKLEKWFIRQIKPSLNVVLYRGIFIETNIANIFIKINETRGYGGMLIIPLSVFDFIVPEKRYVIQDANIDGEDCIIIRKDKETRVKLNKVEEGLGVFFEK